MGFIRSNFISQNQVKITLLYFFSFQQHAALIGGANSQSCPVCHKICLNAEALMDHMRTAHKDPNASGTPSKRKRGRKFFRTTDSILTSDTAPGRSTPIAANFQHSPSPIPTSHPNTSISIPAAYGNSLSNSTASLISQMGMSMGPFVMPSVIGGHHPGQSLSSHHPLNHPQSPYAHHPLAGRAQASFLNL